MWRFQQPFDLQPVVVNGREYGVDAVLTKGRTASASLRDGRIVIRIPRFARGAQASRLFLNLKGRIAKSLERNPDRFEKHSLLFKHGQVLSLLGKSFPIVVEEAIGERAFAKVYDDKVLVKIPQFTSPDQIDAIVTRRTTVAIARAFLPLLEYRVAELNKEYLDARVNRVVLKNMSSRWGSYSKRSRNISLSIKLLFAPQEVLDYVIVHELSHSSEHNHGPKFWSLVSRVLPDYKERRRWLRKHGDQLGSDASNGSSNTPAALEKFSGQVGTSLSAPS